MPKKAKRCAEEQAAMPTPGNSGACTNRQAPTHDPRYRAAGDPAQTGNSNDDLAASLRQLTTLLERAGRIHKQQPKDKNKRYALHAAEVECIGKGKARKPYEFGVKVSIAVTHKSGLIIGARTCPGNPYDGHILHKQLEQTQMLLEDTDSMPKQVIAALGFRGVDADKPAVETIQRGKYKLLTKPQRRWLKRRQAVEPAIGHLKSDHCMDRCRLSGKLAMHCTLCYVRQVITCAG